MTRTPAQAVDQITATYTGLQGEFAARTREAKALNGHQSWIVSALIVLAALAAIAAMCGFTGYLILHGVNPGA